MPEPQVFHPYTDWEDWQSGMWAPAHTPDQVEMAAAILSDPEVFRDAARKMLRDWVNSAEQNLTDLGQNRRAWVGQATCCHLAVVPEQATRQAWWTLTAAEQDAANAVADDVISEWETARSEWRTPSLFGLIPAPRDPQNGEQRRA